MYGIAAQRIFTVLQLARRPHGINKASIRIGVVRDRLQSCNKSLAFLDDRACSFLRRTGLLCNAAGKPSTIGLKRTGRLQSVAYIDSAAVEFGSGGLMSY